MNLPAAPLHQRLTAETGPSCAAGLGFMRLCSNVGIADGGVPQGPLSGYLNHTPSPLGQQGACVALLPLFFGGLPPLAGTALGEKTKPSAPGAEPHAMFRVVGAGTRRQGTEKCPSNPLLQQPSYVQVLPPVATRLSNRDSLARLSGQGPLRSPAAACCRARPSVRPAISPTASLTRANADPSTSLNFAARPLRRTRFNPPAQLALSRDFRVSLKTQKDTPCSRKS